MDKLEMINEIAFTLSNELNNSQLEILKNVFLVKMERYELHEKVQLPSTEIEDNEFILKRFIISLTLTNTHVQASGVV